MSDKADEILKGLGRLKPNEMREVIENMMRQSGVNDEKVQEQLAHLPNRLTADDIVAQASRVYYLIQDGGWETVVSSQEVATMEEAIALVSNSKLQPWYLVDPTVAGEPEGKVISHNEYCDWLKRE